MIEQTYKLGDEPIRVSTVEGPEDLLVFEEWLHNRMTRIPIGVDSETTGLKTYSGDTLRTVQFGSALEGWVIPVEGRDGMRSWVADLLRDIPFLVFQNASFDLQVFERHLGIPMEQLWPKVQDTRILAHLVDPRGPEDSFINIYDNAGNIVGKRPRPGGPFGHSLEALVTKYIDKNAADEVKKLMAKLARKHKTTKDKIFKEIPLDDPEYLLYSGMDPVFAVRLFHKLHPLVPPQSRHLIAYEHELAAVAAYTERNGFLLDEQYSKQLSEKLKAEEDEATWHARDFFDLESVNAVGQIAEILECEFGMKPDEFTYTEKGNVQVDKALLERLAADEPTIGSASHLANAIIEAKRARKWRTTWVQNFLEGMDSGVRVHANINPLRARTARWSITGIPAQTLPSADWLIRRCFLSDPGHCMVSVDYDAQELRVLAALSQDETMMQAFRDGADLHQMTADAAGVSRKVGKMANFLKVYGGGVGKLVTSAGVDEDTARSVIQGFSKTYPQVTQYSKYLQNQALENGYITTPIGRVLPVDEERPYAALNYMVQSTSRDITCRGVLGLHRAGFTDFMRLVIHDEVLLSLPENNAADLSHCVAQLIGTEFRGVNVTASGEVGKRSWGSLYYKGAASSGSWDRWMEE